MDIQKQAKQDFWDAFLPTGISYFALPVFEHFNGKVCHTLACFGKWNTADMAVDKRECLLRSNWVEKQYKGRMAGAYFRLLFRPEPDIWIVYQGRRVSVYGEDPTKAGQVMEAWKRDYFEQDVDNRDTDEPAAKGKEES